MLLALTLALPLAVPFFGPKPTPEEVALKANVARFAPVELKVDLSALPPGEKAALAHIVAAARLMDGIFLRQRWAAGPQMLLDLGQDTTPLGRARLDAFLLHRGPWSGLDHDAAFIGGAPKKPEGANFYP